MTDKSGERAELMRTALIRLTGPPGISQSVRQLGGKYDTD